MSQMVENKVQPNSRIEMFFMLFLCILAGVAICAYVLWRGPTPLPSSKSPMPTLTGGALEQSLEVLSKELAHEFGKPLRQLVVIQKPKAADASQQGFVWIPIHIDELSPALAQKMKESLIAARQHLPPTYMALVVWVESEIILLLEPTARPLTTDQISAFEGVFRTLGVPIAEDRNSYRRFTAVQGRFKGAHGVAIPLRKTTPQKPAA